MPPESWPINFQPVGADAPSNVLKHQTLSVVKMRQPWVLLQIGQGSSREELCH